MSRQSDIPRTADGAPAAAPPKGAKLAGFAKFARDAQEVAKAKEFAKSAVFYDHQAPGTRSRRKMVHDEFEWMVLQLLDKTPEEASQAEIWDRDSFIENCQLWLQGVLQFVKGKIGEKPKASALYARQYSIAWWATRKVEGFSQIYLAWHSACVGLITKLADTEGLETGYMKKNNLSDTDLALFWQALQRYSRGQDNWKQNFTIWMLVYITGVRPSSFAVGTGYEKGAPLGDGSVKRTEDATLRFSDCEFRRVIGGIAVKITFRYFKGHNNPNAPRVAESTKSWTFMPSRGNRYEFDISLLFLGLAFSRGLFKYDTLEELLDGDDLYPAVHDSINSHPVFLQSGKDERLLPGVALRVANVNVKLQTICTDLGYYGRNSMYSLRRIALIEVKRKYGTEVAKETAAHVPNGNSIYAYDNIGQSDIDWTADRLDQAGVTRKELRGLYSQRATAKIDLPVGQKTPRGAELEARVDAKLFANEKYIATEQKLFDALAAIGGRLEPDELLQPNVQYYRTLLFEDNTDDSTAELAALDELIKERKNLKRTLRRALAKEVKNEMLDLHKANMKINKQGARPQGNIPTSMRADSRPMVAEIGARIEGEIAGLQLSEEANEETTLDVDTLNEHDDQLGDDASTRQQVWDNLPDEVQIETALGDDGVASNDAGRLEFLKLFVSFTVNKTSGLTCISCELDETVGQDVKDRVYSVAKMDAHLKSAYHHRLSTIMRAFDIDKDGSGKAPCPLCGITFKSAAFKTHVEVDHVEQF